MSIPPPFSDQRQWPNSGDDHSDVIEAARRASAEIAVLTDSRQKIIHVSESFTLTTGYGLHEVKGRTPKFLQGRGSDDGTIKEMTQVLVSGGVFEGDILNYRKDGSAFWAELKVIPLRLGSGSEVSHFVSVQRDVSNRFALMDHLRAQASKDHLTGLPNRGAAEEKIRDALKRSGTENSDTFVGLIDLDDFRLVNNSYGHAAGDDVLRLWSERMSSFLPTTDILARMGGDEFLVIFERAEWSPGGAGMITDLERLHSVVEEPFRIDGHDVTIGMSMGLVLVPREGVDQRKLLQMADACLYEVKEQRPARAGWWRLADAVPAGLSPPTLGSQRGSSTTSMTNRPRAITATASEVVERAALFTPDAVFIEFQPVVDLRDGSTHLFEALARLRLPDGRTAQPLSFLPWLTPQEEQLLFTTVLHQALEVLAGWDSNGEHFSVSVNIPPVVLQNPATPQIVKESLARHGISPFRLGLEILESQVMDLEVQRDAIKELVSLGVGMAIDDLAAGHSSLQRLSSFPFDALKLDKALFGAVHDKPLETLSIMATLVQMGRDLNMNVVIEGLESESLTEAAIILGAPLGQGFFLAEPQPPEAAKAWTSTFALTLHQTPIQTLLGALAYHWQFARLHSPHPLQLDQCPLTRFIAQTDSPADAETWHERQHTTNGMHPASSRLLITWLSAKIHVAAQRPS